ncbi:MAG: hypothetical protein QW734_03805 [Candidatus Bathyarchaeia archaeon]
MRTEKALRLICNEAPRIKLARDIHLHWASHPELYEKYRGLSSREWDIDWASFYQRQLEACKLAGFPVPTPPLINLTPILILTFILGFTLGKWMK